MVLPTADFTLTNEIEVVEEAEMPTNTYKVDFKSGRCVGMINRLEAMEQAIFKILNTNRFEHMIYSDDYGFENVIGHDELFVRAELPRRIEEALLQDERITSVEDFSIEFEGGNATVKFRAITIYGDVDVLREVIGFV